MSSQRAYNVETTSNRRCFNVVCLMGFHLDHMSEDTFPHVSAYIKYTSHNVRQRTFGHVRPAKIEISLLVRAVWWVIRALTGRIFYKQGSKVSSCGQRRLWSLRRTASWFEPSSGAHISEDTFSHALAHICFCVSCFNIYTIFLEVRIQKKEKNTWRGDSSLYTSMY